MATATDFATWAIPAFTMPLPGRDGVSREFVIHPPSVDDSAKLVACAVRGEVKLGIVEGEIPAAVQEVLDTIGPDEHPALGSAYQEMVDAGVNPITIDRMAYYAVFYWTRGRDYADALALLLWGREEDGTVEAGESAPKD